MSEITITLLCETSSKNAKRDLNGIHRMVILINHHIFEGALAYELLSAPARTRRRGTWKHPLWEGLFFCSVTLACSSRLNG